MAILGVALQIRCGPHHDRQRILRLKRPVREGGPQSPHGKVSRGSRSEGGTQRISPSIHLAFRCRPFLASAQDFPISIFPSFSSLSPNAWRATTFSSPVITSCTD